MEEKRPSCCGSSSGSVCRKCGCEVAHSDSHFGVPLRRMKDWRPLELSFEDKQFILRQAKKYHVEATKSKLVQSIIMTLELVEEPKRVFPSFARHKMNKRKYLTKKDFPGIPQNKADVILMFRPYAYIDLLENKEDALLIISLVDMIGFSKIRKDMVVLFEKNYGFDIRMEQVKKDASKKRHGQS